MLSHDRAIVILEALLAFWFFQLAGSTQPALVKRVSDPMALPDPAQKPVVWTNIHCGDEFGSYRPADPLLRSCTDYGLRKYSCDTSQCHMGTAYDSPKTGPLNQLLYFRGCHMLGTKDQKTYLVYAYSYLARNKKGFLIALGFAVGDMTETVYSFKCPWDENSARNNRRVWCDKCYQAQDSQIKKPPRII